MTEARYRLFAPAKINFDLRITGRRPDGYHTIRSHILFADWGDTIDMHVMPAGKAHCTLRVTGPFADQTADLYDDDNMAVRAVRAFCALHSLTFGIHIDLVKNIPARAGLGGGSSDAAALLRGLAHHTNLPVPLDLQLSLGADVPVCYAAVPALVTGIGETVEPWQNAPACDAVILWDTPGPATADLYATFDEKFVPPDYSEKNDFQSVATYLTPSIADHLAFMHSMPGCREARLTGSGSAVFGLFSAPPVLPQNQPFRLLQPCRLGLHNKPLVTSV